VRGGCIKMGMANHNPQSVKIELFPENFVKGQSMKILSRKYLALYSSV